jgi:preprotein translocase subunit YajC
VISTMLFMGGTGSGGGQGANPLLTFLPFIAIIFVMYFLMIRPQAKKQKEHKAMLEKLEKGDKVLTSGGIIGTIAGVKENEGLLIVKIADNVKVELSKGSIAQVLKKRSE